MAPDLAKETPLGMGATMFGTLSTAGEGLAACGLLACAAASNGGAVCIGGFAPAAGAAPAPATALVAAAKKLSRSSGAGASAPFAKIMSNAAAAFTPTESALLGAPTPGTPDASANQGGAPPGGPTTLAHAGSRYYGKTGCTQASVHCKGYTKGNSFEIRRQNL